MNYYTYFHTRNDNGAVFYIGKGLGSRAYDKGRNEHWNRIVEKHGHKVHIAASWETEAEAFEHEKFLILCFKDMGVGLTNMTPGGEGGNTTGGRSWMNLDGDRKIVQAENIDSFLESGWKFGSGVAGRPDIGDLYRGVSKSTETKAKISKTLKGRLLPEWHKKAISLGQVGSKRSDKTRAKMSKSASGKIKSLDHRSNLSKSKIGKSVANNGLVEKRVTHDELSDLISQGWVQGLLKTVCPHCGKSGGRSHLTRWHFNNCKVK